MQAYALVMGEEEKILQTLAALEDEHQALDSMITKTTGLDQLQMRRLKKRKLWLKDEIARLHNILHPDIIA